MSAVLDLNDIVYDFQTLGRFTSVSRRFAAVVNERRADIYAAHVETLTYNNGGNSSSTYVYGSLHSVGDAPAIADEYSGQYWYQNGKLHRDGDQPGELWPDGSQRWYQHGQLHRDGDKQPLYVWVAGSTGTIMVRRDVG